MTDTAKAPMFQVRTAIVFITAAGSAAACRWVAVSATRRAQPVAFSAVRAKALRTVVEAKAEANETAEDHTAPQLAGRSRKSRPRIPHAQRAALLGRVRLLPVHQPRSRRTRSRDGRTARPLSRSRPVHHRQ